VRPVAPAVLRRSVGCLLAHDAILRYRHADGVARRPDGGGFGPARIAQPRALLTKNLRVVAPY
jgi:hypothetical protein